MTLTKKSKFAIGLSLVALSALAGAQDAGRKTYIVELADAPVAAYEGGVAGIAATRPARGDKLKATSANASRYLRHLDSRRNAVAATVPGAKVLHRYNVVFNGFSARLTRAEVAKLAANRAVKSISEDVALTLDTSYTPSFLGIDGPNGIWNKSDANGRKIKGENVIIGVIDTGVWPENTSVSDKVDTTTGKPVPSHTPVGGNIALAYDPLPPGRFTGTCETGPDQSFKTSHCNNKLIGARFYTAGVLAGGRTLWNTEFVSPRDEDGHGSHTSSTAGGNEGASGSIAGNFIASFSGIAPRARLSVYKTCWAWNNGGVRQGNCFTSDSVAAIDQAVADGVDVINYSISGSRTSYTDAIETAFKRAAYAGVFVAASAGNSNVAGNASTVAHISPWITTVGNSTHDRYTESMVTLGDGYIANGASFQATGLAASPLTWSRVAGINPAQAAENSQQALCYGPADGAAALLDPAKVTGKIVVCDRGGNVLVNKVANAKAAGAVGVIIQNTPTSATSTPLIAGVLPTVHLTVAHFAAVTAHALTAAPTAAFGPGLQVAGVVAPVMSSSSSRGPNQGDANMLKPDITAPGSDIIAAYTNTDLTSQQRDDIRSGTLVPDSGTNMISGTSMSSPHVAGAAALMKQARPGWSPSAIKSSLMTSAQPIVKLSNGSPDTGLSGFPGTSTGPFGFGAGHLNPNGALDTGLVYDVTPADYDRYIAGTMNRWDLNVASITRANVAGPSPVQRKLTNTGSTSATYVASATLPGFTVTVNPSTLTIPAGGTATYTATIARTTAGLETWSFGDITWTEQGGAGKTLRSPVQAKGSLFVGVPTVNDTRTLGAKVFTVGTGWSGQLVTEASGLVPATRVDGTSVQGQPEVCFPIAVPTGTRLLRVALFNVDTQGGAASDIDLVLYRKTSATTRSLVGSSGSSTSDEFVMVTNPTASPTFGYEACVDPYAPLNGSAAFTLSHWVVGAPVGPQTLRAFAPPVVHLGGSATVALSWNVPAGARYLGIVQFRQTPGGAVITGGNTPVIIDPIPAAPAAAAAPVFKAKEFN